MEAVEQGQGLVHDIGTDLVGGLAQGSGLAGRWRTHTEHVNSFSSTRLPLLLVPSVPWMTVLAGVAGVFLAPALACAFVVIDRQAPTGTVTEAFSWLVTTFGVGAAAGTAVAGPALEWGGTTAGFAVAVLGGAAALGVLLGTRRVLVAPPSAVGATVTAGNDRDEGAEPGFRAGNRA